MQVLENFPTKAAPFLDIKLCYKDLSQRWLYKNTNCLWKLVLLVFLGLCGMFMCVSGVERQMPYFRARRAYSISKARVSGHSRNVSVSNYQYYPQPATYDRKECRCTPVQKFAIFSMQRTGSGWFETLLNSHPNVSSHGEIFSVEKRRENMSTIKKTLDTVYSLDWDSSASKNECTAAVGLKWMLNQGLMEYKREVAAYLNRNSVSVIFLFRRNILRRYVSILANTFDREKKQFNGTHRAHVHSKEEASLLAAYKPTVNLTSLITYMKRIEEIMLDALLSFNGTRNMVVYYEDLVDMPAELKRVQEFLHVDCRELQSKHVKIHTLPLSGQIENWRELSTRLKGTKYESFVY
ncbi:hypothetical protein GOP47_0001986 [Adiantum capillus-veneris]|uniref:Sulfotransferase n=1 Tax=Adiantum capillus-veneris TaxID=13818 RepID=A0A9D4V9R0_ADICA|nr:hypothetical protein GOP47_0001986 [Adiantum capillus-veneris]